MHNIVRRVWQLKQVLSYKRVENNFQHKFFLPTELDSMQLICKGFYLKAHK